jgi:hypothetical protein
MVDRVRVPILIVLILVSLFLTGGVFLSFAKKSEQRI